MTLGQWQSCVKPVDEYIIQASCIDGSDSLTQYPIGFGYGYMSLNEDKKGNFSGSHDKLVYTNFSTITDKKRRGYAAVSRESIKLLLEENGIRFQPAVGAVDYYQALPSYKFVISPEGNGIDCHRHYEALIAGCIPIIENNHLIRDKYYGCPILYTEDYSEINHDYLEEVYCSMKDKIYDFSRLFLSYYNKEQQEDIKQKGNYWCLRLTGKAGYT